MPRKKSYKLDRVAIRMVKEPPLYSEEPVTTAEAAIRVMRDTFREFDREVVCLVNLKSNMQPINLNIVSIGALDQAMIHPRELLKSSILSNASSVLIMHNHPSGKLDPSQVDIAMTDRMQQVFTLIGIDILDHIIIGDNDNYYSFREHREMPVGQPHYTEELAEIRLKEQFPLKPAPELTPEPGSVLEELSKARADRIERKVVTEKEPLKKSSRNAALER